MNNKKIFGYLLLVLILGVGIYALWGTVDKKIKGSTSVNGTICTMDAIQCPDGSWVGRSGPDCQFVCPTPRATTTPSTKQTSLQGGLGQTVSGQRVSITPTKVVEDSRCPTKVQCIQAGTVRVQATVVSGMGTSTPIFTLDKPVTTEAETITLISVNPVREQGKTIKDGDYLFTWKVAKR